MKTRFFVIISLFFLVCCAAPAFADVLWYNGDFDGDTGRFNGYQMGSYEYAMHYDDFDVPAGGWDVSGLWSNNRLETQAITQAYWEIRSGVSAGNGGVLVDYGVKDATLTPTGRTVYGVPEYTVSVAGLNVSLNEGKYWLGLAPDVDGEEWLPYIATTSGANAVGTPAGTNGNAFYTGWYGGTNYSEYFIPSTDVSSGMLDFSMGVQGTPKVVPEPLSTLLFVVGGGVIAASRKLRRRA